ncbi:unnamed protein product [Adineta steineri]|uniref:Protein kinase domain-containing protein n=3 Tax=Adineta steineri TaxID=433720 RepID=A0A815ATN7_9BILA|nr:unnamed protein product [Adineta steineri]
MPPLPDVTLETIILHQASTTAALNGISSSDELNSNIFNRQDMDLGSLTVNSSEEDEPPTLTEDPIPQLTTCPTPSISTGERDPPVIFRKTSTTTTTNIGISNLPQVEVRYQNPETTNNISNDDNTSILGTFLGCFKPIFSAVNRFSENIKYNKDTIRTSLVKPNDDWEISVDNIMNDLELIGSGIEGSVFHGKLHGQDVAWKRVKTKEETNIKHLKKLNHINVIKFRGIAIASPLYYIVMEYCAYGSLYDVLKRRRDKSSCTKPTQVLDWSRQIANGVDYLHSNKIVHRDLKSPNILFSDQHTLKISDFGTSKELVHRRSQIMSFSGTSAWMAPEVIRQELCSEKIDVWSFGIVVWEILTCAVPYNNIDPTAVMWGVGKGSLTLPVPTSAPEGFKLLMTKCWNQQSSDRPSFSEIIKHLDISEPNIVLFEEEQKYAELTRVWSIEINEHLSQFPSIDISSTLRMTNDELMKKRQEELQHIIDIRTHYQKRVQQVDTLYMDLKSLMMQVEKRERIIKEKERTLNINVKKRTTNPISEARKKSLELIKIATSNLNDPIHLLSYNKKRHVNKINNGSSNSSDNTPNPIPIIPSSITKNNQRRKKNSGHNRTNSKENATSPREESTNNIPIPSISADIDSKLNANNRELNAKNLRLTLENQVDSSRLSTEFSIPPRKSSSSEPEEFDKNYHHTFPRTRRRRHTSLNNNNEIDHHSSTNNLHKHSKTVTFHLSSLSTINDRKFQRKISKHSSYTSSEEGEVEEVHSDSYILDDEKYRAKHSQLNGNYSSESEIYNEKNNQLSVKNDGVFSDEGGHISDDRHE